MENTFDFTKEVGVSQHHAFGIGGCAGGVEQGRQVIVLRRDRLERARTGLKDRRKIGQPFLLNVLAGDAVGIHQDHTQLEFGIGWAH
jgi:hypothetical protein